MQVSPTNMAFRPACGANLKQHLRWWPSIHPTLRQSLVLSEPAICMSRYETERLCDREVACSTSDHKDSDFSLHETPANAMPCSNAGLLLSHRLRHWPSNKSAFEEGILFISRLWAQYSQLESYHVTAPGRWTNVGLLPDHRLRRWPNIKTALA